MERITTTSSQKGVFLFIMEYSSPPITRSHLFPYARAVLSVPPPSSSPSEGGGKGWGCSPLFRKEGFRGDFKSPFIPLFQRGFFSGEFAVARFLRSFVCTVAPVVRQISHFLLSPPPTLALRASVNGLTNSPSVLYGAHYSSHQHPPPSRGRKLLVFLILPC